MGAERVAAAAFVFEVGAAGAGFVAADLLTPDWLRRFRGFRGHFVSQGSDSAEFVSNSVDSMAVTNESVGGSVSLQAGAIP